MPTLGDELIVEMSYFAKGHTAFQNAAAALKGGNTDNMSYEYQIDVNDGNGWNGSWKTLDGANLSAETIDPALGFKLKYRITTTTANTGNYITYVRILTDSTLVAQQNLYILDEYDLVLTGLQTGTRVALLETGTETLIGEIQDESGGEVSFTIPDSLVGDGVDIAILAAGYLYQRITNYILTAADVEIPIVQSVDYAYNSGASADCTFDGSTKRIVMDAASTELDVVGMYSDWVDWALTDDNLAYDALCSSVGGNDIDPIAGTLIPVYVFLDNTWRIAPDEADHTLAVTTGIVLVSGGGDPFVDTAGAYTVRINYQQPVQAITVSTGGGGGITQQQVRDAMKLAPSGGVPSAGSIDEHLDNIPTNPMLDTEDGSSFTAIPDMAKESTLGTPANIDGGGATVADNLKKLADDNGGADYDATTDSLHEMSIKVGVAAASAAAVDGRLPLDPADESDVEAAITASQGVITTAISTSESNIRGADGDDLKDISDQIDGVAIDAAASAASSAAAAASAAAVDGRLPLDPADESNVLGAIAGVSGQINAVPGDVWDEPVAPHNIADTFGQRTEDAYQWDFGEWQIVGDQIIYRDKAGVEIGRCDLFDQAGNPTMVNIFRRVPI